MPQPIVDILIPAYNAAATIGRTVRSLQAQTLPDWRAVIVDDGSTDGTAARAQAMDDGRLHLVRSQRNLGRGRTRALGLSQCTAPFVALLDADDWSLPERLECLLNILEADPSLAYVGSASAVVDIGGRVAGRRGEASDTRLEAGWRWKAWRLFHPTLCLRREVFKRIAYSTSHIAEDFVFMLHLCRHFSGCALGQLLYVYEEGSSLGAAKYAMSSREVARVLWQEPSPLLQRAGGVAASAAKTAAYGLLSLAGLQNSMLKQRTDPVDPATTARIETLRAAYMPEP